MKRNYLVNILLIFLILAFTVGLVSASDEANVNLTAGDTKSFDDIQHEVDKASQNDVINLNGHYQSSGKEIKVTKSLTFSGSDDTVLDANHKSDIFYAPKRVSLTFKNIQFLNSKEFAIGTNSNLGDFDVHIINCSFKNSGNIAVSTYGANLIVEGSRFENNEQAIQEYTYPLTVKNCTFIANSYCAIQAGDAEVSDSSFISNGISDFKMGAIYANNLKVTRCEFTNNSAWEYGGAIWGSDHGSVEIYESNFTDNRATYLGGAIYLDNTRLFADKCRFINNSASNGAAIYALKSDLNVYNSSFTKNSADSAAIYSSAVSNFKNTTFDNNTRFTIVASKLSLINCNSKSMTFDGWVCLDDNLTKTDFIKITLNNIFTYYQSGKTLTIKLVNTKDNSLVSNCMVKVILKSDKKTYVRYLTTDSNGKASFDISRYNVGRYNLLVSVVDSNLVSVEEIDEALIYEASPIVKAPKVKFKYKKSKYFKVTIKNKKTKKAIKGLKIKLKVYTGKKYKVYKIKTNKKGVAKFNTKKLKRGKHKVIITSLNKNYAINKNSLIRIK